MPMGYLRRMQNLIDQHAPWLKMSCTEFNYGDASDIVDSVLASSASDSKHSTHVIVDPPMGPLLTDRHHPMDSPPWTLNIGLLLRSSGLWPKASFQVLLFVQQSFILVVS